MPRSNPASTNPVPSSPSRSADAPAAPALSTAGPGVPWESWLALFWLTGVALMLLRIAGELRSIRLLRAGSSSPNPPAPIQILLDELSYKLGLRHRNCGSAPG